ncbi:recombinase [bacterium D16-76]|nr:recombinase [bacterium D16-76]
MFNNSNVSTETPCQAMAYYRLSKDDGNAHESDSIQNQRKLIHAYLQNHPYMELVDEAYDDGYTGTNYDRPGFRSVLEAINAGRVNCVIVKDLSRLGREYIETGKYLEMIFPSLGVRFIAINDDVDSSRHTSGDDIIIPIKNIMNESYCRELSKKLRRQFRIQRGNGEFLGAFASFGYCKSPDDKHKLVIDDFAAEVVRGIFSLKLKGYSIEDIAAYLNNQKLLSPAEYKKSQGLRYQSGFQSSQQSKWSPNAVRRILENPLYAGTLVQGKRGTPHYKLKQMRERQPEDWVTVEGNHPAVIDKLTFDLVQKLLQRDTRKSKSCDTVLPLCGVVFCADCGRPLLRRSVTRGKRKFFYYICSGYKKGLGCTSHSFEQGRLEMAVLHALSHQIHVAVEIQAVLQEIGVDDINALRVKRLDIMIAQKNTELDGYRDFRMKLYEALGDDLINKEEYDIMRAKYTQLIEEGTQALVELKKRRSEELKNQSADDLWLQQFSRYQGATALNREMVAALIDKVYVYEDKRIKIDFNYRDELAYYLEILQEKAEEVV